MLNGKCLVNEIRTRIPMKNPQNTIDKMMSGLQEFIPEVYYVGYDKNIVNLGLPINPLTQPETLQKINSEYDYDYLIDFHATTPEAKSSGVAFGSPYFDHKVSVSIAIYQNKTGNMVYYQNIELEEHDGNSDEDYLEDQDGVVFTRSSENLMKIGIKKCTNDLRKSIKRKIESGP